MIKIKLYKLNESFVKGRITSNDFKSLPTHHSHKGNCVMWHTGYSSSVLKPFYSKTTPPYAIIYLKVRTGIIPTPMMGALDFDKRVKYCCRE
jgi:hypothetical protein